MGCVYFRPIPFFIVEMPDIVSSIQTSSIQTSSIQTGSISDIVQNIDTPRPPIVESPIGSSVVESPIESSVVESQFVTSIIKVSENGNEDSTSTFKLDAKICEWYVPQIDHNDIPDTYTHTDTHNTDTNNDMEVDSDISVYDVDYHNNTHNNN